MGAIYIMKPKATTPIRRELAMKGRRELPDNIRAYIEAKRDADALDDIFSHIFGPQ